MGSRAQVKTKPPRKNKQLPDQKKTNSIAIPQSSMSIEVSEPSEPQAEEEEFKLVEKRRPRVKKTPVVPVGRSACPTQTVESVGKKRWRLPKTQAVVLEKPTGTLTYADMVREAKEAVRREGVTYDITTRRAKSGNIIFETAVKEQADNLAGVLKREFGESKGVRRPAPSIALLLIGIEDAVDEDELGASLVAHDSELKAANKLTIREGANGVRTAIVRVPLAPGLRLVEAKKIKVGWAICRVKELVSKQGCWKCTALGHVAADCTGRETRKCFRCKTVGHLIATCNIPPPGRETEVSDGNQGAGGRPNGASAQL